MPALSTTAPSSFQGMGAIPTDGGVLYRVWAPFATAVTVGGDFLTAGAINATTWTEFPMARDAATGEGANYWSIFVKGAVADTLYKFKITNPTADTGGIQWPYRHDPYAKDATGILYLPDGNPANSVVVAQNFDWSQDKFSTPGWNDLVIYELHIGTFNRNEAGVQGTFGDAKKKLAYVAGLGFNAIEIMPAFDFSSVTSMGYNPSLPFAMANAYGTLSAMKQLIEAAHATGLAVLLDVVYNHFGSDPGGGGLQSCLAKFDGWTNPGWEGIYFYEDDRMYTPWGWRPDYGRGEVRQYLRDHAIAFCLDELHADGLRLDSTISIRHNVEGYGDEGENDDGRTLLRWFGEQKRASSPGKILIAEDLQNEPNVTLDALFGGIGLDAQWDNWFLGRLETMMFASDDNDRNVSDVGAAITKSYNWSGPFQRIIYIESHDQAYQQPRIPACIAPTDYDGYFARRRALLGTGILMTSPGIPMIFMGTEFLEYAPWSDSSDYSLDWSRTTTFAGFVNAYQRLVQLRRNWDNNTRGLRGGQTDLIWCDPGSKIIVYRRYDLGGPGDDVIVVANLSNTAFPSYNIGFPATGTWYLRFNSDWQGYCSDFGNLGYNTTADGGANMGQPASGNVGINAYSVLIYSQ
jgi:1,4-alpha-glucan branching enzyme